jgi:hypothetical protein
VRRGVTPAAALAFLLSAPAINPVVLVATSVAFPRHPRMVVGRLVASLLAFVGMDWLWLRLGRADWLRPKDRPEPAGLRRSAAFLAACRVDMTKAGGYLAVGAVTAATLNVAVPPRWLHAVAGHPVLSAVALSLLAVVLSICSEADAFVAASLTQFSLTARLAFLEVGPMVDAKLFAMQAGGVRSPVRGAIRAGHVRGGRPVSGGGGGVPNTHRVPDGFTATPEPRGRCAGRRRQTTTPTSHDYRARRLAGHTWTSIEQYSILMDKSPDNGAHEEHTRGRIRAPNLRFRRSAPHSQDHVNGLGLRWSSLPSGLSASTAVRICADATQRS